MGEDGVGLVDGIGWSEGVRQLGDGVDGGLRFRRGE